MLRQRERELADQRRVLAEEYRLLRTQRPARALGAGHARRRARLRHSRRSAPAPALEPKRARFTPVRHETAWARIKRLMLGNTSSALEEN